MSAGAIDLSPWRDTNTAAFDETLLGRPVLSHLQASGRGRQLVAEHCKRLDRDILELIGDDVALLGEAPKRFPIVICGAGEAGGDFRRAGLLVRVEDMALIAEAGRSQRHHPAELAAAQYADGGTGGQNH